MDNRIFYTCCFVGHRKIKRTKELEFQVITLVEDLIVNKKVATFLFGSKSEFDTMCLEIVGLLRNKYPHIKRVYVRAEYPYINEEYKKYLLKYYDETFFPEFLLNAGKSVYVQRNYYLIDTSDYCIFYFLQNKSYTSIKSGSKLAFEYATKKKKKIFNFG